MPTSLVTGCAGFIGSHLCDELLRMGHKVVGIDDLSGGFLENIPTKVLPYWRCDITNTEYIREIFEMTKPDYIFHLAAYAAEGLSHFIRRYNYENNLIGSINLINAAVNYRVKQFIFTSSMAVYGSQQVPYTEDMIPAPEDPYGIAKAAVERELKIAHDMFGMDYVIFRPHNVYGERQNIGDPYRNVIGIFMNQIMSGKPMTIFGDGTQTRAFSYISDIAPVIARSIEVPEAKGKIFNIGGETPVTINKLANIVKIVMGAATHPIEHHPPRVEIKNAFSDHSARRKVFGDYEPVSLTVGLNQMAKWALARGPQSPTRLADIEISRNLPGKWRQV